MLTALLVASCLAVTLPPEPANHISDQAQLLSPSEVAQVEGAFQTVLHNNGVKLGLLTLSELDDQPKVVAVRTLNYWNMSPDSVLLLVSLNPKKIYVQPGSNLAGVFNEQTSTAITRQMVPFMKGSNFGQAVLTGFTCIANTLGGYSTGVQAPVAQPPQPLSARQQRTQPQPIQGETVQITAPAPKQSHGHPFLTFLLLAGGVVAVVLIVRAIRRSSQQSTTTFAPRTPVSNYDPYTGTRRGTTYAAPSAPAGGGTTVINNTTGGSNDGLLTGLVVGNMLSQPHETVVRERVVEREPARATPPPEPVYTPPPSPPRPSRSSRSSDDSDSGSSSSGSGGGGSSLGSSSSDSGSSYGSGGGGSDWGSSGGGFDSGSSGGGGGGGSDW